MKVRLFRLTAAVLVVTAAIWGVIRVESVRWAPAVPSVPADGANSPPADDVIADSAPHPTRIPDRLPAFALANLDGKATPIGTWNGKSLIINFWATWCAPCRQEIPLLEGLAADWAGRNVQVVGIAVDHRDAVSSFARKFKIAYPLLIGEQDALDVAAQLGFDAPVFPFTVFTDRRGEVVALFVGELHPPQAGLILSVVQNLNEDHIGLTDARRDIAEGLHKLAADKPG